MKAIRILMIIAVCLLTGIGAYSQVVPDSIAICEPGDAPTVIGGEDVSATASDVSRLMTVEEIAVAADSIMSNYDSDWTDLSMQGKLSFDGLPMSVSVKIYMKRGESLILSARAPFLGEVARLEANQDSITFINKHTRCYNVQSFGGLDVDPKAYLCDLQDILLGQVAFPGHGRLTSENAVMSQWIALPAPEVLIYPSAVLQTPGTEYGFVMDSAYWQLRSFVLMLRQTGVVIETKYSYGDKGWTLGLEIELSPKKKMGGEVQLSYPDYAPTPLDFTVIGSKYRKVDFKQLMKF
ncbi:MAG: DUF4292 domain-containing protein [Muribaculaceae bacterium]|nr:DUF4292 domain-containing protein [Muribaculaceae bacterium]